MKAINVKVYDPQKKSHAINAPTGPMSRTSEADPPAPGGVKNDPVPAEVPPVSLPPEISLGKFVMESLSQRTGLLATRLKVCVNENRSAPPNAFKHACNSLYADDVSRVRTELRNAGASIEALDNVVARMERGASEDELLYIAKFMDELSQELGKRSRAR